MASTEVPAARRGRGRRPLEAGEHGRVTTRAWVIDKATDNHVDGAPPLTWDQLDLDSRPATVLINATINGVGQRQPHTKTRAGVRRLVLPPAVTEILRTRRAQAKPDSQLVFPATRRRNTDRVETPYWTSNITGQIRTELDRLGDTGISGRSFRKMVATELDKHGYTPRQIADQLGHARPSVTLDIYQNRENAGPHTVANIL